MVTPDDANRVAVTLLAMFQAGRVPSPEAEVVMAEVLADRHGHVLLEAALLGICAELLKVVCEDTGASTEDTLRRIALGLNDR